MKEKSLPRVIKITKNGVGNLEEILFDKMKNHDLPAHILSAFKTQSKNLILDLYNQSAHYRIGNTTTIAKNNSLATEYSYHLIEQSS